MNLVRVVCFVLAAFAPVASAMAEDEVEVTADRFVVMENQNQATFSGNVVIVQGTTTVRADTVDVHYGEGGASDIESFEAVGHLIITTPTQKVTGQRGTYDPKNRVMHVFGDVVSESDSGRVTGTALKVDFIANTTEFSNGDGTRVTGVFNPSQ